MNKDLLPCPFCGGEAQLFQRYPRLWNVQCEKCSVVMDPCQRSVEACKEEWNTRAESSTLSTLSARVEEQSWHTLETAPYACHVLAARFDHGACEWIVAVVASPPIYPFTRWRMLPSMPEALS